MNMTNLELFYIIKEICFLRNAKIEKIYDEDNGVRIKLHVPKKGSYDLVALPNALFLSTTERKHELSGFVVKLRKHLKNERIVDIRQMGFDRVVDIETRNYHIIFELFRNGNYILTDKEHKIIAVKNIQKWKDRELKPKVVYKKPYSTDITKWENFNSLSCDRKIISLLTEHGFGKYVQLILNDIDKDLFGDLEENEKKVMFKRLRSLLACQPRSYVSGNEVFIFPLPNKKPQMRYKTISEAFEFLYNLKISKLLEEKAIEIKKKERMITLQQKNILVKMKNKLKNMEKVIEIFNNHYAELGNVFQRIKNREKLNKNVVINRKKGLVTVNIDGVEIELDFTKTLEENRVLIYSEIKKLKRKIKRAEEYIGSVKVRHIEKKVEKQKKSWFENYRFFYAADGSLVVAGKDAQTNEELIKKHVEKDDVVVHAEIKGAPFVIIKGGSQEVVEEAAEFAAAYSKAWSLGLGSVDVYWVKPKQVTKSAPSGEYLPKGAFMIIGKKNYVKNVPTRIAIGFEDRIVALPIKTAISKNIPHVMICPGDIDAEVLAKKIKDILIAKARNKKEKIKRLEKEEIKKMIPSRKGSIINP